MQLFIFDKQLSAQRELLDLQQNESREHFRIAKLYTHVEELAVNIAAILHSMLRAMRPVAQSGAIDKKRIDSYDKEAHILFSKIVGLQATTAAVDMARLDSLRLLVDQICKLDADIGLDGALFKGTAADHSIPGELQERAIRYCERASELERNLPHEIRNILESPSEKARRK